MPTALRRAKGRSWAEESDTTYRNKLVEDPEGAYRERLDWFRARAAKYAAGTPAGGWGMYPLLCCEAELWGDEGQHDRDCPGQS